MIDLRSRPLTIDTPPLQPPLLGASVGEATVQRPALEVVPALVSAILVELVGMQLRASGLVDVGRFARLSDYVNVLDGYFPLRSVTLQTRTGDPTRIALPELRIRLDDVTLIGQRVADRVPPNPDRVVPKERRRLVLMTAAHLVAGFAYMHAEASLAAFIDATDPPFLPMTDVRVRWLADRRLTGRFAFALVQRSHIVGVGSE